MSRSMLRPCRRRRSCTRACSSLCIWPSTTRTSRIPATRSSTPSGTAASAPTRCPAGLSLSPSAPSATTARSTRSRATTTGRTPAPAPSSTPTSATACRRSCRLAALRTATLEISTATWSSCCAATVSSQRHSWSWCLRPTKPTSLMRRTPSVTSTSIGVLSRSPGTAPLSLRSATASTWARPWTATASARRATSSSATALRS
mmetsp:Transcript_112786/g.360287  ORF Transcript_112786/g.360287 Transcript_112786/m.360287 type:complete len:203 (-) Transcript_112786:468-1076(-)